MMIYSVAQLLVGFFALMRLSELTNSDTTKFYNTLKVTRRSSIVISDECIQFFLPGHKTDKIFEGNTILINRQPQCGFDTYHHLSSYLASRDKILPLCSPLWLRSNGSIPTRSWFINRLHSFFANDMLAGPSLRAGGATSLAEMGSPPSLIQAIGRWTSESFRIYMQKNPILIQGMLFARRNDPTLPAPTF